MEKSGKIFEVKVNRWFKGKPLTIRPEQTTDGVPIYHCYLEGTSISQLRREPSGKWEQLWGDLPKEIVQQLGEAIADQMK